VPLKEAMQVRAILIAVFVVPIAALIALALLTR
jgi:hypothetical protein